MKFRIVFEYKDLRDGSTKILWTTTAQVVKEQPMFEILSKAVEDFRKDTYLGSVAVGNVNIMAQPAFTVRMYPLDNPTFETLNEFFTLGTVKPEWEYDEKVGPFLKNPDHNR